MTSIDSDVSKTRLVALLQPLKWALCAPVVYKGLGEMQGV